MVRRVDGKSGAVAPGSALSALASFVQVLGGSAVVWGDGGRSAWLGAEAVSKAASQVRSLMNAQADSPLERQRRKDWILRPQVEVAHAGWGREPITR